MTIRLRIKHKDDHQLIATLHPYFRVICGILAVVLSGVNIVSGTITFLPATLFVFSCLSMCYHETWVCDRDRRILTQKIGVILPFRKKTIPIETIKKFGCITISQKRAFRSRPLSRSLIYTHDGRLITIEIVPKETPSMAELFAQFLDLEFDEQSNIEK